MTTLFNTFCPLISYMSTMTKSVFFMIMTTIIFLVALMSVMNKQTILMETFSSMQLFLDSKLSNNLLMNLFLLIVSTNILSLICYSYPVTTTLSFNLSLALSLWSPSVILVFLKPMPWCNLLPPHTPWYLVPFLSMVELVSILLRPLTLCFRLLANMSAGHILLALILGIDTYWVLGAFFILLETMVCVVQGFVFIMLVVVYMEEAISH